MRLRGWFYSLGMKRCSSNFQVAHDVILRTLETIEVGSNVYLANGCIFLGGDSIVIGNDVLVGPMTMISTSNHCFNGVGFVGAVDSGQVVIEDNCWIGGHCSILMGTYIRESSVVGAGSVCNKAYDSPKVLIAGNPAKIVKNL